MLRLRLISLLLLLLLLLLLILFLLILFLLLLLLVLLLHLRLLLLLVLLVVLLLLHLADGTARLLRPTWGSPPPPLTPPQVLLTRHEVRTGANHRCEPPFYPNPGLYFENTCALGGCTSTRILFAANNLQTKQQQASDAVSPCPKLARTMPPVRGVPCRMIPGLQTGGDSRGGPSIRIRRVAAAAA